MVLELGVLGVARKLLAPSITLCKKIIKNLKFTLERLPKIQSIQFGLIGTLIPKRANVQNLDNE